MTEDFLALWAWNLITAPEEARNDPDWHASVDAFHEARTAGELGKDSCSK